MNPSDFGADIFDANAGRRPDDDQPAAEPKAKARTTKKSPRTRRKAAPAPADADPDPASADADPSPVDPKPESRDDTIQRRPTTERREDPAGTDDSVAEPDGSDAVAAPKRRRRKRPADRRPAAEVEDRDEPGTPDDGGSDTGDRDTGDRDSGDEPSSRRDPRSDEDRDDRPAAAERGRPSRAERSRGDEGRSERSRSERPDPELDRAEEWSNDTDDGPPRQPGESDDDVRGRRRRRRRRRGRGEDEGTASEGLEPRVDTRRPLPRSDRMIPVPTPDGELHGQRVAILVQLEPLLRQAKDTGGELAFGKLLQQVAQRRHLIRAIAYADSDLAARFGATLRGNGIEVHSVSIASDLPIAIAVDAMTLARRVDSVVLIPDADGVGPLAAALRAQGVRVETAGFIDRDAGDDELVQTRHRLGAESLFVP